MASEPARIEPSDATRTPNAREATVSLEHSDRHALPLSRVVAIGIGNALEFYDFLTFSFFAIQIGHAFFPEAQTSHGLLFSLATFGIGFFTRPLGGIVIGTYGDRVGRKPAMMLSFALMGVAIVGMALTPPYAQIGLAAPILLLIFRLLQGFALGGEVGPSTALLIEAAPPHRRALYVAVQSATQGLAILAAGAIGFILSHWLTPAALESWGWRCAFLIGAAVVPVGLYIRRSLPETSHATDDSTLSPKERHIPVRLIVLSLLMLAAMTITTYVRTYLTTYAQESLKLATDLAFGATVVNGLCGLLACPLAGLLADRVGRKPVMLTCVWISAGLSVPSFLLMNHWHTAATVYGVTAVLSIAGWAGTLAVLTAITESLPRAVRSGALATIYAVAIALFGGSTQFIVQWLIEATGSPLAPAWYNTAALAIGGVAIMAMRETAPAKTAYVEEV